MAKIANKDKSSNANQLTRKLKQSASQIWLAGLGAYSKAEEEGNKLFDTLVREGDAAKHLLDVIMDKPLAIYQDTLGDVLERVEEVKDKAVGSWDRIEKAFDERVASALHRLNIPTRQDVADLAKQVMQCKAELRQLQQTKKTSAKINSNNGSTKVGAAKAVAATAKVTASKPVKKVKVVAETKKSVSKKSASTPAAKPKAASKTASNAALKTDKKGVNAK